jgi:DNA-binding NarL/FixJ family response regulator
VLLRAAGTAEHLSVSAPDLIISESQMPGCSGATLTRMVRRANPTTPLIILIPSGDREMESDLLRIGVSRVLCKPIQAEALVQAVKGALPITE